MIESLNKVLAAMSLIDDNGDNKQGDIHKLKVPAEV